METYKKTIKPEIILQKINLIPKELQFQVLDYIDFLISRYKIDDEQSQNEEITSEMKVLLDERIDKYEKNPTKTKSWEEIEERLLNKHNYNV